MGSELGIGMVYWPALAPLFEADAGLIDVVEVEPQAYWTESNAPGRPLRVDGDVLEQLNALPQPKVIHSVGCPLGGSARPDPRQIAMLEQWVEALQPVMLSEHLAFNRVRSAGDDFFTMFMLPPRQTRAGVEAAVSSIRAFAEALPAQPLLLETGVNYLKPRADEMLDGEFINAVVEQTDCGILLDLHNLWINEHNGRQPLEEVLAQLPLDRVWEMHLAGGVEQDGYLLDSHSTTIDPRLMELCEEVLPRLPHLRLVTFELLPTFVPRLGLDAVARQLEALQALWRRGRRSLSRRSLKGRPVRPVDGLPEGYMTSISEAPRHATSLSPEPSVLAWEQTLGRLVTGQPAAEDLSLAEDPGVALVARQVQDFRAGMVAEGLALTTRLLLMAMGEEATRALLRAYWERTTPQPFVSAEAAGFAEFLWRQPLQVPYLADVLCIEHAKLKVHTSGLPVTVTVSADPLPLLKQLGAGQFPENVERGNHQVTLTADGVSGIYALNGQREEDSAMLDRSSGRMHLTDGGMRRAGHQ